MLRRKLCQAAFVWTLHCDGPLLIADGRYDQRALPKDEKGKFPDKVFISRADSAKTIENAVRSRPPQSLGLPFYVPGTSLRGPFRAQAERIIRSLLPDSASPPVTACDPFDMDENSPQSCSKRLDKTKPEGPPYAAVCPACQLFGCTATASRIQFTDADLAAGYRSVFRDMIGIDRFTGGVFSGANMRFHALENTTFTTTITLTNFELWQLGLLAYVFRDFKDGLVPIGFGKTKGFGLVSGAEPAIMLSYPANKGVGKIQHLGSLMAPQEAERYGLTMTPAVGDNVLRQVVDDGLNLYQSWTVADQAAFGAAVAPAFNEFIAARSAETVG